MADKKSRKELLKEEDAFIHAAKESAEWATAHKKPLILGSAAGIALILALVAFIELGQKRDADSSAAFLAAMAVKDAQVVSGETKADPTATPPTFASDKERDEAAKAAFTKVVAESGSAGVALMSRLYLADYDVKAGELDKALATLTDLSKSLSQKDNLYFLVLERLAYLKEQKGDIEGAMAEWHKLKPAEKKSSFYGDRALYELARLHATKGEADKAREALTALEKDYAETSLKEDVQELFAKVGRPEGQKADGAEAQAAP